MLCSPGWPQNRDFPASVSQLLGLQTCTLMASLKFFLFFFFLVNLSFWNQESFLSEFYAFFPPYLQYRILFVCVCNVGFF
jgi:hypothetical protein